MTFYVGQTKRISGIFYDTDEALSDPTWVELRVGVEVTGGVVSALGQYWYSSGTVSREATGRFYVDYTLTNTGTNVFEYRTSGTPAWKAVKTVQVLEPYGWSGISN